MLANSTFCRRILPMSSPLFIRVLLCVLTQLSLLHCAVGHAHSLGQKDSIWTSANHVDLSCGFVSPADDLSFPTSAPETECNESGCICRGATVASVVDWQIQLPSVCLVCIEMRGSDYGSAIFRSFLTGVNERECVIRPSGRLLRTWFSSFVI